jgi:sulfofructose kinase
VVRSRQKKAPARTPRVDLVGVGLNSLDTLIRLPRFPAFDSKVEVISTEMLPGGQVATATVACQRWGLKTRYIGKIGDDSAGQLQRQGLEAEGIELHLIEVADCLSQVAFILVDEASGERTVLWKRDPRLDFSPSELPQELIVNARLLHVDGHPSPPAALAARWAREAGVTVLADLDNIYAGVEALLEHVDFLVASREFPERVLGIADPLESLPAVTQKFGCRVAGVTLGQQGALAWDGRQFHYCPAFAVEAVDTTGAGDVFHAAFAYCLIEDRSLSESLEFSCAAAGLNCTVMGARGGIKSIAEISELVRTGRRHPNAYDAGELRRRSAALQQKHEILATGSKNHKS